MLRTFRISVAMVLCSIMFTTTSYALPDGAVARLGKGQIGDVSFSPDGTMLAVASSYGVYLYDTFSQAEINFIETDTVMSSIAFSPDGSLLASGSNEQAWGEGAVKLWDVKTLVEVATLEHSNPVRAVAFSSDGRLLASGGEDSTKLWDVSTHEEVATLLGHKGWVHSVVFSPDDSLLAVGSFSEAKLWDVTTHQEIAALEYSSIVYSVAFSPDGKLLAGGGDGSAKLWDVSTHEEVATLDRSSSVAFSPDGDLLASGGNNSTKLWDVATHQEVATLEHSGSINSLTFSPDGSLLVSENGHTIKLWDVATHQEVAALEHSTPAYSIAFSPDGKLLASGGWNAETVMLWDVSTHQQVAILKGHFDSVYSVAFSPDGKLLASGDSDNTVKLWDVATHQEVATLEHSASVYAVAFSPDGKSLASGGANNTVKLWDVATHQEVATLEHSGSINSVAFSPDGSLLASGGNNSTKLWDVATHQEVATHTGALTVAFSPDVSLLAGVFFSEIKLWDVATHQEVATLSKDYSYNMWSVAFSPDGRLLASGGGSYNTVTLWDASTHQPVARLKGHFEDVHPVAFSPDGSLLVSGDYTGTILLWDTTPYKISRIRISPPTAALETGGTQQFTMSAYNSNGQAVGITNIDVTWSVDGNIGTIDENGLFTATTVGNGTIGAALKTDATIATHSEMLTVEAGDPVELTVPQPPSQVKAGEEYQFTVSGKDVYGNNVSLQSSDVIWSVVDGVGSISTTGIFVSTEAGNSDIKVTLKADPGITATTQEFTIEASQAVEPGDKLAMSWSGVKGEYAASAGASPSHFALGQNFPNPFNPETWIPYQLTEGSEVKIWIYGTGGKLIRQLDLGHNPAGFYLNKDKAAYWDGYDDNGNSVASGVYFYQIQAGRFSTMKKLVVLR